MASQPHRSRAALLSALALLLLAASCRAETRASRGRVFLLIGDGMGLPSEIAASRYRHGEDRGLAWHSFPFQAWAATWDVTSYDARAAAEGKPSYDEAGADPFVGYDPARGGTGPWPAASAPAGAEAYLLAAATDSAAAATAMSTGRKTDAGNIAWKRGDPLLGGQLDTLTEIMESLYGGSSAVLSTVPFDHATPAAFVAHSMGRGSYPSIARQMIGADLAAIIGGGHPDACATYLDAAGLGVLRSTAHWRLLEREPGAAQSTCDAALAAAAAALPAGVGLFGLYGGADGSYGTPLPSDSPGTPSLAPGADGPTLAASVAAAAGILAARGGPFLLVAEQGEIDWANHANDYGRMVGAVCSLDDAVRAVEAFVDRPGDDIDWGNSLLVVTADHATGMLRFDPSAEVAAKGDLPEAAGAGVYAFPGGTARYATTGHSNELVTIAAKGALAETVFARWLGAGRPGTRIVENAAIFEAILAFLDSAP